MKELFFWSLSLLLLPSERQTAILCPVKSSSNPDARLPQFFLTRSATPKGVGEFVSKVFAEKLAGLPDFLKANDLLR